MNETHPLDSRTSSIESDIERTLSNEPYRVFNIFKDISLSSNPITYSLQIRPGGGSAQTPSPAYHTPRIPFYKHRLYLPASFGLYHGGSSNSNTGNTGNATPQLASVKYKGVEGLFSLRAEAEIYPNPNTEIEPTEPPSQSPSPGMTRIISITRENLGRTYHTTLTNPSHPQHQQTQTFYWKGTKAALSLVQDKGQQQRNYGTANGNLKLVAPGDPGEVLAVWQNRTDKEILGSLCMFSRFEEGDGGLLEDVVVSCLAVVLAERTLGRGWLGGLGK